MGLFKSKIMYLSWAQLINWMMLTGEVDITAILPVLSSGYWWGTVMGLALRSSMITIYSLDGGAFCYCLFISFFFGSLNGMSDGQNKT